MRIQSCTEKGRLRTGELQADGGRITDQLVAKFEGKGQPKMLEQLKEYGRQTETMAMDTVRKCADDNVSTLELVSSSGLVVRELLRGPQARQHIAKLNEQLLAQHEGGPAIRR